MVLDAFVVMPDHVHLLFGIVPEEDAATVGATRRVAPTRAATRAASQAASQAASRAASGASGPTPGSVGAIIGQYKSAVTKRIRVLDPSARVWQRSFHDRVVRTDREAEALRRYILDNPARWDPTADRGDGHRL